MTTIEEKIKLASTPKDFRELIISPIGRSENYRCVFFETLKSVVNVLQHRTFEQVYDIVQHFNEYYGSGVPEMDDGEYKDLCAFAVYELLYIAKDLPKTQDEEAEFVEFVEHIDILHGATIQYLESQEWRTWKLGYYECISINILGKSVEELCDNHNYRNLFRDVNFVDTARRMGIEEEKIQTVLDAIEAIDAIF